MNTENLKHKEITDIILRGFYEVYNELGDGFLESVYENALYIVISGYGIYIEKQKSISVFFRGNIIGDFKADLIVDNKVIIELKAVRALDPAHESQLINYLKATNIEVGLLLNFGKKPEFKRFVYDNNRKNISVNQWLKLQVKKVKISIDKEKSLCNNLYKFNLPLIQSGVKGKPQKASHLAFMSNGYFQKLLLM